MSIISQHSTSSREVRNSSHVAQPLPRLASAIEQPNGEEKYEVVVVGGGPAGLLATLLLARYGLSDSSLLCIDAKAVAVRSGQADGISGRTQEVLKTLGLVDEIRNHGMDFYDEVVWATDPEDGKLKRTVRTPFHLSPVRFGQTTTLHQGRMERILSEDLAKYSKKRIERATTLVEVKIDEVDAAYPVLAVVEHDGHRRTIHAKYMIGADGAHSVVRRSFNIKMHGDSANDIWGVLDFVVDTDFPDIRRMGRIDSPKGNVLQIPREQIQNGDYLTRLYVPVGTTTATTSVTGRKVNDDNENGQLGGSDSEKSSPADMKAMRQNVNLEDLLQRINEIYSPYKLRVKTGTEPDWLAAYVVGQRYAERLMEKDSNGIPRIFLVGDACHTHSPKLGQGMNVSMMDSYDLTWKLIYHLHGLCPLQTSLVLLQTYETDRLENAMNLIDLDKRWYSARFAAAVARGEPVNEEELRKEAWVFASGAGVEYEAEPLTDRLGSHHGQGPIVSTDYSNGTTRVGRRFFPVDVTRFADGRSPWNIHDDFPSNGRWRVVLITTTDLLDQKGRSAAAITRLCTAILPRFADGLVELVVLEPLDRFSFEWDQLPACLKTQAEMRFHYADPKGAYVTLGVDPEVGAVVVVRPDGFVGSISEIGDLARVESYLRTWVVIKGTDIT